jgi:uncharacterized repeat protein (TIGR01451 family)
MPADNNPIENNSNLNESQNFSSINTPPKISRPAVDQYNDNTYNNSYFSANTNAASQNWNSTNTGQEYYDKVVSDVSQNPYFEVQPIQPVPIPTQTTPKATIQNSKNFTKRFTDFFLRKWWLILLVVLAISLSGLGFYAFQLNNSRPSGNFSSVQSIIEAPSTASSGSPVRWKIRVINNNKESIQNIEVKLNFDRTFRYTKPINPDPADSKGNLYRLSSLSARGQGTNEAIIQFEGVLSGNTDEEAVMSGEVSFVPSSNINKTNQKVSVPIEAVRTRITSPQIGVTMTPTTRDVQNGTEAEIAVVFENLSEKELKDLRIRMTYPDRGGFTYTSSELVLDNTSEAQTTPDDGNNIWFIRSLPRLRTQTLKIRGIAQGADGVKLNFLVEIDTLGSDGSYQSLRSTTTDVVVTSQPLVITNEIEGKNNSKVFRPGETLTFTINYQNKSNKPLTGISVLGLVDDEAGVLDYATLAYVGGVSGDLNNGAVQWTTRGVPQLENLPPQARGVLKYTIKVKDNAFSNTSLPQSAYTLRPRAEASSKELKSIQFSGEEYKGVGQLGFIQEVKTISQTKSQATVDVTWILNSRQSVINDVKVLASTNLPPNSWQAASILPIEQQSKIAYNPANGKIEWNAGQVGQYAGNGKDPLKVTFRFIINAQENQSLQSINILDAPSITGVDDFTGEEYDLSGQALKGVPK